MLLLVRNRGQHGSHPAYRKGIPPHSVSLLGLSYRHNFCKNIGFDRGSEPALLNKIHPDAEVVFKVILEMDEIKKGPRPVELHKDIDIARLLLLAPYIGPEYPQIRNTVPFPEFRQVGPEIPPDLVN